MMYELWDERGEGVLTPSQFDRAAHQHPLLVQAHERSAIFDHRLGEFIMSARPFLIIASANPS